MEPHAMIEEVRLRLKEPDVRMLIEPTDHSCPSILPQRIDQVPIETLEVLEFLCGQKLGLGRLIEAGSQEGNDEITVGVSLDDKPTQRLKHCVSAVWIKPMPGCVNLDVEPPEDAAVLPHRCVLGGAGDQMDLLRYAHGGSQDIGDWVRAPAPPETIVEPVQGVLGDPQGEPLLPDVQPSVLIKTVSYLEVTLRQESNTPRRDPRAHILGIGDFAQFQSSLQEPARGEHRPEVVGSQRSMAIFGHVGRDGAAHIEGDQVPEDNMGREFSRRVTS
jgi:hypothetical protein